MDQESRWNAKYEALLRYVSLTGSASVPTNYVDGDIRLGSWVNSMRTRYRKNILPQDRVKKLESVDGWEWGPLRPGCKKDTSLGVRNSEILELRRAGRSLAEIGEAVGLTRQRVHQIVKDVE